MSFKKMLPTCTVNNNSGVTFLIGNKLSNTNANFNSNFLPCVFYFHKIECHMMLRLSPIRAQI